MAKSQARTHWLPAGPAKRKLSANWAISSEAFPSEVFRANVSMKRALAPSLVSIKILRKRNIAPALTQQASER
jgi:hypothetical protein